MILIGDVHGKIEAYRRLCMFESASLQLGDMGLGFQGVDLPVIPGDHWFIRGNHDNPSVCAAHPRYFGDWGCRRLGGVKIFFISGAYSIDRDVRVEGRDWWPDEELSYGQLRDMIADYILEKPEIVVSHAPPESLPIHRYLIPSRTGAALQAALDEHRPARWIFGHMHHNWKATINGTEFQCLNELETTKL